MPNATETDPTDTTPSADAKGAAWHAVLVIEGSRTSDGREFAPGSLRWRTPPLPLMMQLQTDEKHKGSVVVGRIDRIERKGEEILGWGVFDLGSENGREAQRLVSEQILRGVSIDAELMEIDKEKLIGNEDGEMTLYVEEARIGAVTMVHLPAFPQAVIALDGTEIPAATEDGRGASFARNRKQDIAICLSECKGDQDCMSKCMKSKGYSTELSVVTDADLVEALGVSDKAWDGAASRFSDAEYKRASAGCRNDEDSPKTACFLPHHDPSGALNRAGLQAAAARFNQVSAPPAALSRARSHLRSHYRQLKEDPPKVLMQMALVAHAEQQGPPAVWFENPELKGPTPLTVARNGRIYGHAALWDACHTGYNNCMRPPRSRTNYSYFLTGSVFPSNCDCDGAVATGPITIGTRHADVYQPSDTARRHYDHTGLAVADVVVGEDDFGIWIAGALRPGVSEAQIRALRGSALSGDWRYIGGNLELVALLAVNTPGFPIPRVTAGLDAGMQVSLVAAGIPDDKPEVAPDSTAIDPADIINELKREQERKQEQSPSDAPVDTSGDASDAGDKEKEEADDKGSKDANTSNSSTENDKHTSTQTPEPKPESTDTSSDPALDKADDDANSGDNSSDKPNDTSASADTDTDTDSAAQTAPTSGLDPADLIAQLKAPTTSTP